MKPKKDRHEPIGPDYPSNFQSAGPSRSGAQGNIYVMREFGVTGGLRLKRLSESKETGRRIEEEQDGDVSNASDFDTRHFLRRSFR